MMEIPSEHSWIVVILLLVMSVEEGEIFMVTIRFLPFIASIKDLTIVSGHRILIFNESLKYTI